MLELDAVSMRFGGFAALTDVSLRTEIGQRHAVIGPNGAGKSTLFNVISGYLSPTLGRVRLNGQDITGADPHRLVRAGLGRSFQRVTIFESMTVFENVQAALLAHHGQSFALFTLGQHLHAKEAEALMEAVGLAEDAERIAATLAYGRQKQLELALALATDPRVLLLDEPTAGMSPRETREILGLIMQLQQSRGFTLLFTEHDMEFVFAIADRLTVLSQGMIIADGTPEAVRAEPEVRRVYLGEDDHAA